MTASEFESIYSDSLPLGFFADRLKIWEREVELDRLLGSSVGGGVVIGDLLVGDGLRDQVSPELLEAFETLMGDKASSYDQVRGILLEKVRNGDKSVHGLVSKVKGQVGENAFIVEAEAADFSARLAASGSQEGWDVAVDHADGTVQYVQVKMYADADGVMGHMEKLQAKLSDGHVIFDGEATVSAIDFAVPADIAEEVAARAVDIGYPGEVLSIPMSAADAAAVVEDGFNAVGPEALSHFFGELAGGTVVAAALHSLVNGFLWYKGEKTAAEFRASTAEGTALSASGIAAGLGAEAILSKIAILGGPPAYVLVLSTSIATRGILSRLSGRTEYVEWLRARTEELGDLKRGLESPSALTPA